MLPTVKVGGYEVTALTDAVADFEAKSFFPTAGPEQWAKAPAVPDAAGKFKLNIGCFLLRGRRRTILVDGGLGPVPAARFAAYPGHLDQELARAGASLSDIDTVVFTHLHVDHVGWSVRRDGAEVKPQFPNARYLGPRLDWEEFNQPRYLDTPRFAYFKDFVQPLKALGVLDLIEDGHQVAEGVRTWHTPGHTPGHMAIAVGTARGNRLALMGDLMHHLVQLADPSICPAADINPALAAKTRAAVLDRVAREGTIVAGAHLPIGFARVHVRDGVRHWTAIDPQ